MREGEETFWSPEEEVILKASGVDIESVQETGRAQQAALRWCRWVDDMKLAQVLGDYERARQLGGPSFRVFVDTRFTPRRLTWECIIHGERYGSAVEIVLSPARFADPVSLIHALLLQARMSVFEAARRKERRS
jgi:hypothetical protein